MQRPTYTPVSESHGAPICPRCRARIDARRGPTTFCHSCGAPLPQMATGGGGISTVTVVILGLVAIFAIAAVAAIVIVLFARPTETSTKQPTAVTTITVQAATPPDSASASASASSTVSSAPLTQAELDTIEGNYTCSMDDTPAFACRISNNVLEKLAGSQRFRGPIVKNSNGGFSFSGTFFCPFGDCTHPVACTFSRTSAGHYSCRFGPNSVPGGGPGGEHVVLNKVR
ncbi:MAG: hypothetical protein ACRELY_09485 [Polyangiaceae bacterium]